MAVFAARHGMSSKASGSMRARAGLTLLALVATAGHAAADSSDPAFTRSESFLGAHPDLDWRYHGIENYKSGHYAWALIDFHRAARFADKTSQAIMAQMYWNGDGVTADRVIAYVWADLAAERGYPDFIATREKFWSQLSDGERQAAIQAGPRLFSEYGDAVAKKREENELRRALIGVTGSHTTHVGASMSSKRLVNGRWIDSDGASYWGEKYWTPEKYWRWQDRVWTQPPEGKVEVGPIQTPPGH